MNQLRATLEQATPSIELAASRHPKLGEYKPDMVLHLGISEFASELLGAYLKDRHGIDTEKVVATLQEFPLGNGASYRHYALREQESGSLIDPTFTQFMKFAGLVPSVVQDFPMLKRHYPTNKITVVDANNGEFGIQYGAYVDRRVPEIREDYRLLGLNIMHVSNFMTGNRIGLGQQACRAYSRLWQHSRYNPVTVELSEDRVAFIDTLLEDVE